ncbi:hypothetical protein OAG68_01730 [bacterium]|nr:hypothetical protein [bacterium]
MLFRFAIADVLILTFFVAIILLWKQFPEIVVPQWDTRVLPVEFSPSPPEFLTKIKGRPILRIFNGQDSFRYRDGGDLYKHGFYAGFSMAIERFIDRKEWWVARRSKFPDLVLSDSKWEFEHYLSAQFDGCDLAIRKLEELLSRHDEQDLREALSLGPSRFAGIGNYIPEFLTGVFCVVVVLRIGFLFKKRMPWRLAQGND